MLGQRCWYSSQQEQEQEQEQRQQQRWGSLLFYSTYCAVALLFAAERAVETKKYRIGSTLLMFAPMSAGYSAILSVGWASGGIWYQASVNSGLALACDK
jgi:hypothetical protein